MPIASLNLIEPRKFSFYVEMKRCFLIIFFVDFSRGRFDRLHNAAMFVSGDQRPVKNLLIVGFYRQIKLVD